MYGVVNGVYYCNNERVEELNKRIYERNIPSHKLQQVFDPRPTNTRRTMFPAFDCEGLEAKTKIEKIPSYNPFRQFNPGTSAPFSGYATNIDQESRVRNIFMPNQKYTGQTTYVPSTKSDLYNAPPVEKTKRVVKMPHQELFKQPEFAPFDPTENADIGYELFNNHTRQQTKNIRVDPCK